MIYEDNIKSLIGEEHISETVIQAIKDKFKPHEWKKVIKLLWQDTE